MSTSCNAGRCHNEDFTVFFCYECYTKLEDKLTEANYKIKALEAEIKKLEGVEK